MSTLAPPPVNHTLAAAYRHLARNLFPPGLPACEISLSAQALIDGVRYWCDPVSRLPTIEFARDHLHALEAKETLARLAACMCQLAAGHAAAAAPLSQATGRWVCELKRIGLKRRPACPHGGGSRDERYMGLWHPPTGPFIGAVSSLYESRGAQHTSWLGDFLFGLACFEPTEHARPLVRRWCAACGMAVAARCDVHLVCDHCRKPLAGGLLLAALAAA